MTSNARVFLSAGEASGDQYGAELIAELRGRLAGAQFFGLGGLKMAEAGQERVVRAEDVAHMGITEVVRHMPYVYGQYRRLVASIKERRPDGAVLIDFPDVNFRLARELKKLGVPVVWFVSPQLWAWKRGRLRWVQERVDRMMVIFPFEQAFYKARGVEAEFVGHPLAEGVISIGSREEYADENGLSLDVPWVALLPGSRWKEVVANLPTLLETAVEMGSELEFLIPVASTLDDKKVGRFLLQLTDRIGWKAGRPGLTLVDHAGTALHHARASVVASGTATVLAAVAGNPFVVVYRVSGMTYRVAKRLVSYPTEIPAVIDEAGNLPVGMVNLIAGRRVVPELLQERFTGENVAAALRPVLEDGPERERMMADLAEVRAKLRPNASPVGTGSGETAIQRVASAVEELLAGRSLRAGGG